MGIFNTVLNNKKKSEQQNKDKRLPLDNVDSSLITIDPDNTPDTHSARPPIIFEDGE